MKRISGKCFQQSKYQALIDAIFLMISMEKLRAKEKRNFFEVKNRVFLLFRPKIYENRMSMISARENKSGESMKFEEIALTKE